MSRAEVAPVLLGPRNCEAACGMPWRHVRDTARALGVELVHVGRKLAVPAAAFLEALAKKPAALAEPANDPVDGAAAVRALLGKRRRA
ncbi:MAG TPA: hypothetical protein VFQ35_23825 [Polyangiaceae bacterium]|jgi:hypothetical protein|nr:hypothetical protein [Polyangiaceae bacterium]